MKNTCHVLFSNPESQRCNIRNVIFGIESLLSQLKRKDPNAAIEKIVLGNDFQLQLKVSEKITGVNYNGLTEAKQEGLIATCLLTENSSVAFVIQQLRGLIRKLSPWLLQKGWYPVKSITFQDGVLSIERTEHIMTIEKLRKIKFPGQSAYKLLLIDASSMLCEGYFATTKND
ncbi:hypothetical protein, partial [Aneurinibacillus aneurinilyticus]|nr:hypothetical protein [Aneurinibacillus aneurinilyticus]